MPFVIDDLTLVGSVPDNVFTPGPDAGARTDQMPLLRSVVAFAAARETQHTRGPGPVAKVD